MRKNLAAWQVFPRRPSKMRRSFILRNGVYNLFLLQFRPRTTHHAFYAKPRFHAFFVNLVILLIEAISPDNKENSY